MTAKSSIGKTLLRTDVSIFLRPVGQAVKTPPFHGGNTSSILVRVTTSRQAFWLAAFFLQKIRLRFIGCRSSFAKGHAHVGYSVASALITPLARYQPFARIPVAPKPLLITVFLVNPLRTRASHLGKPFGLPHFFCKKYGFALSAAAPLLQKVTLTSAIRLQAPS